MNVKEIRRLSGLSVGEFTKKYHIPYTTFHDWEIGNTKAPIYVLELLERVVREDFKIITQEITQSPERTA